MSPSALKKLERCVNLAKVFPCSLNFESGILVSGGDQTLCKLGRIGKGIWTVYQISLAQIGGRCAKAIDKDV